MAVETKIVMDSTYECSVRTAFIEYLKERHDLLMYEHLFIFANKQVDPTKIAQQLASRRRSSLYFCDLTFFLLMDAFGLCGTFFLPQQSTSSFNFENQDTMSVMMSHICCIIVGGSVYIMDTNVWKLPCCPIRHFLKQKYSQTNCNIDVLPLPSTHVVGIHGAGTSYLKLTL